MNDSTMNDRGYFLLSFDTELAWGHHDKMRPELFSPDGTRERQAVKWILDVLDEFGIIGTWAFVGHLFFTQCEECTVCPILSWQGNYPAFDAIYNSAHPLWYGADILAQVRSRATPHEIAFHGYTHSIFDEAQMSAEAATVEIAEWMRLGARNGIVPRSVVFPRNKVGHLDLLCDAGFTCYRGEETMPTVCTLPLIGRFFRRFYYTTAAFAIPPRYDGWIDSSGLVNLPSSRWLFGVDRRLEQLLDRCGFPYARVRKMARAIRAAADERKIVHFWAHPYEFRTQREVDKLRFLLAHAAEEIEQGRLYSIGMADMAEMVLHGNA